MEGRGGRVEGGAGGVGNVRLSQEGILVKAAMFFVCMLERYGRDTKNTQKGLDRYH